MQSVFYQYGVPKEAADILAEEGLTNIEMIREANPDGGEEARKDYEKIEKKFKNGPTRRVVKKAICQLLLTEKSSASKRKAGMCHLVLSLLCNEDI